MPSQPARKVRFLIVGAQKAGTTVLHSMLSELPDLYLPAAKELHFFDDETATDWNTPDYAAYEARFDSAARWQICGEATPIYMFLPECAGRIHAFNPQMKIVVMLRQPALRAWSQWRMEWTKGKETEGFSRAIRQGRTRFADNPRVFSYVERGFYAGQIRNLMKFFPRRQLHVLLDEDLRDSPKPTIERLCGFLGCPCPANVTLPRDPVWFRSDPSLDQPPAGDIAWLNGLFHNDIVETGRLVGRDLTHWLNLPDSVPIADAPVSVSA